MLGQSDSGPRIGPHELPDDVERIRDDLGIGKTGTGHGTVRAPEVLRDGVQSRKHPGNLFLDDILLPGPENRDDLSRIRVHKDALVVGVLKLDEPHFVYGEVSDTPGVHPGLSKLGLVEMADDVADGNLVESGDSGIGDGLFQRSDHGLQESLGLLLTSFDVKQPFGCRCRAVRAVIHGLEQPQDDVLGVVPCECRIAGLVVLDHGDNLAAMLAAAFLGGGDSVESDVVLILVGGGDGDLIEVQAHFTIFSRMVV